MAVQQRTSGLFARLQRLVDSYIITPQTRKHYWERTGTFAQEQPLLFVSQSCLDPMVSSLTTEQTFVLVQFLFSCLPLALFTSFVLGTLALSLITALIFSLFWTGVALIVLIPTLFVTVGSAILVWMWAIGSFLVVRWVYDMVPVSVRGTTEVGLPNGKKFVVDKGEGKTEFSGGVRDGT